jgi:XRE family transcriptional regulator, regulator of sulfur utilization
MNRRDGTASQKPVPGKRPDRREQTQSAPLEQQVGEAIRRLRDGQGLSVRTLASKCGFSASFISQVELNQASPSLASLERIASGLGVTLGQFFLSTEPAPPTLIKASQRPMLQSQWSRSLIESLSPPGVGSKLEALLITIRPGGNSGGRMYSRETELFAIIFSGEVRLQIGETSQVLRRGDAITIPPGTPHSWENKAAKDVQLLKVAARLVP